MVIASVSREVDSASKPTGRRIGRRPMPSAVSAMISLSADIRPSPSSTPMSAAIGGGETTLQVSPTLQNLPVGNPPNHNSREFQPQLRCRVGSGPVVANHHLVVFGNHVFDGHPQIRNFFERGADILDRARRPWWQSRWDVSSVVHKSWREIHLTDTQVLPVHELLKMIADEILHLRMRHSGLGVLDFRCSRN